MSFTDSPAALTRIHQCSVSTVLMAVLAFGISACSESPEVATSVDDAAAANEQESGAALVERARAIHDRVVTIDTHADINTGNFTETVNYTMNLDTQVNLVKMAAGGLDVAWFIVYTGQSTLDEAGYAAAYANAIDKFDAIHRLAEDIAPDEIGIAYTSDDVRRLSAEGKQVAMIGIENAYPVGLDLANIKDFHDRGGRYMSLAHNGHSQFADSNTGENAQDYIHEGLSDLGREALAEMNKWGIIIDVSHPSKDAIMQMLALTRAPLIASHSSARALTNHSRNLDDEMLLAIKDNGGVVQTVAFGSYINEARRVHLEQGRQALTESIATALEIDMLAPSDIAQLSGAARSAYEASIEEVTAQVRARVGAEVNATAPAATVADFVDHIDYMVGLIGEDHVGISSDFDGGGGIEGWNDASETFNVTLELVRRGYTEQQIEKMWSGNLLRVLDEVQAVAARIQAE
ncbi:MAG: dipeptidase [Gammaproteobacteria bacterium]|jgi:membrane dipeptidase|nr:dipeptidase [Gammaproteobacteria bacterium]MDG1516008.1 dipeptidase [Gammaproteobacteria bacterium]MDG1794792.1 dipeptidase [Gammaproteobacteria bacterium]